MPRAVDALPLSTWGPPTKRSGFDLTVTGERYHLVVHSHLFAETIVLDAESSLTTFTGGPFFRGPLPKCGARQTETREARWMGFSPLRWTDTGIDVEMGRGRFDLARCA